MNPELSGNKNQLLEGYPVEAYETLFKKAFPEDDPNDSQLGITDAITVAPNLQEMLKNPVNTVVSCGENGNLLGFSVAVPIDKMDSSRAAETNETAYIYYAAVEPSNQGQGIIKHLMDDFHTKLADKGYTYLEADCVIENGFADKVQRAYGDAILEMYDHTNFPEIGPERFFRIDLNRLSKETPLPPTFPKESVQREITSDDIAAFIEFDNVSFFDSETPEDHRPPHFTSEEIQEALDKGHVIRGVFDSEGKLLAASWFEPNEEEQDMYVYSLNVSPALRDKGVGKFFLDQAEAEAKERGFKTCSLHVDPLNARGLYLYMKQGYRVEQYETSEEYGLQNWVVLRKHLGESETADLQKAEMAETGDEAELQRILSLGHIGTNILLDESGDPYRNKIVFSAPVEKLDEI